MQQSLRQGISPVRGIRRFERYSKSYSEAIRKGYYGDKAIRPVNLILSGQMLRAITHKASTGFVEVGIWDPEMVKLAGYHQEGTPKMPARKFIPTEEGEYLTVTIDRALRNRLRAIIKESIK